MKTYLEISVPIRFEADWFIKLRVIMNNTPVIWQKGYYHITMAFCDETPDNIDIPSILDKHFKNFNAPKLCFNKLDVFQARSGMYIINLGTDDITASFTKLVEDIRKDLKDAGCMMQSEFKLHVTLGRIKDIHIDISQIKELINSVTHPVITLNLTDVDYREYRGRAIYKTKLPN